MTSITLRQVYYADFILLDLILINQVASQLSRDWEDPDQTPTYQNSRDGVREIEIPTLWFLTRHADHSTNQAVAWK